jgi:hypothetical protein
MQIWYESVTFDSVPPATARKLSEGTKRLFFFWWMRSDRLDVLFSGSWKETGITGYRSVRWPQHRKANHRIGRLLPDRIDNQAEKVWILNQFPLLECSPQSGASNCIPLALAGPEPGAVIVDSSCAVPKKQRQFRRAGSSYFSYLM